MRIGKEHTQAASEMPCERKAVIYKHFSVILPAPQRRSLPFRIVTMEVGYLALGVANRERCFLILLVSVLTQVITPKEEVCSGFHKEYLLGGWMDGMHLNSHSSTGALKV